MKRIPTYILLIISLGFLLIYMSSSISKNIEAKNYIFSFDVNSKYPENMTIYHDSYGVNFVLGHIYECSDICIELLQGLEKDIRTSNDNIKLEFKDPENDNFRFRIDAFNTKNIFRKDLFFGLGISFLSSGIVLLLEHKRKLRK